jgi:signal transduction histidine kinase
VRISIKIKFSVFLAALLLLTVFVLSLLVLRGIQSYQVEQYEQYLAKQAKAANVYFMQTILAESNKAPQIFLNTKGIDFAEQLELLTGQSVALYDRNGEVVSKKTTQMDSDRISQTLAYALKGKTAYLTEQEELYYLTPLEIGNEQVGVIQIHYSLADNIAFYNRIRQLLVMIGAGIFILSFILAYFYFNFFANGIIKLEKMVDRVRIGDYRTTILRQRDEIGRLSEGIHTMSGQIMSTIQDMKEEQEKLKLAVNKLSLLDQQQKQFIGNVTHEFKTPLTSIKAYIDLLEMYPDDDKLLETAKNNIKSETQRLYEMVDKVLQLSALEKYDFEYHPEKIDIKETILSVLSSLKGKINKFGIQLETELSQAYVKADPESLTIILMNLMDNAIKYNRVNGRIIVKNSIQNNHVLIEITDTGIGIPKESASKIFDPFYMVDKNRSRQNGGSGLGLSIAKKYAEVQGGSVSLINTDGSGTTFRITFPVYSADII